MINISQNNEHGDNETQVGNFGNSTRTKISVKLVWKHRAEGFIAGVITSMVASYLYDVLKTYF